MIKTNFQSRPAALRAMRAARAAHLQEKLDRTAIDGTREEQVFRAVMYANIVRREFAFFVLREMALPRVVANKGVYRQRVKQFVKAVKKELTRWDCQMAYALNGSDPDAVEHYDCLTEKVTRGRLRELLMPVYYSFMQVFTRNGCTDSPCLAAVEAASVVYEFARGRLVREIEHFQGESPMVRRLGVFSDQNLGFYLEELRRALGKALMPRGYEDLNLNADHNCTLAVDNLLTRLVDADAINALVDEAFVQEKARQWGMADNNGGADDGDSAQTARGNG